MPRRMLLWIAVIVVGLAAAFAAIVVWGPDPVPTGTQVAGGASEGPAQPQPGPAPSPGATPAAGAAAPTSPPAQEAAPADPQLVADVAALAAERTSALPQSGNGSTLYAVEAEGTMLLLDHRIDIVIDRYDPVDGTELVPGLIAMHCDDDPCFEFRPNFTDAPCADEGLTALLARGATADFRYWDLADEEIARFAVTARNCG